MSSEKDREDWDGGSNTRTTALANEPWPGKQEKALVRQTLVTRLPLHPMPLHSTGIEERKLWLVLLLVSSFVLFGVALDLWRFWHSQPSSSDSSEIRTSRDRADVLASGEDQLSDLQNAAKVFLRQGNVPEARRTCDAILKKDPKNVFALGLKKKLQPSKAKLGVAISQPHRQSLVYLVIHDHFLGGCRGKLKIDSESVAFVPEGDSKDGFSARLADIVGIEAGDALKIKIGNKTYRFNASHAGSKKEVNPAELVAIENELIKLKARTQ